MKSEIEKLSPLFVNLAIELFGELSNKLSSTCRIEEVFNLQVYINFEFKK